MRCEPTGSYGVDCTPDPGAPAIGVYNSSIWQRVYLGAAPDGAMLRGAYNIVHATTGVELLPSAANMTGDNSATGRRRPECAACHYSSPYALDHFAALLPFRRDLATYRVVAQTPVPQALLDGRTYASIDEALEVITNSAHFRFWTCQLLFRFATGRPARACESQIFQSCLVAMESSGNLRDAILPIITSPEFCAEDP
jgi:hypothetical protein